MRKTRDLERDMNCEYVWDRIWESKKYITDFSLRWHEFIKYRGDIIPEEANILEAGCGSGEGVSILAGKYRLVVGLDISEKALLKASTYKNILLVRGTNFSLPFSDNVFDLVFNSGVIEHFKYPHNIMQLREMARVTKPGGNVIVNVPNSLCLWYIAIKNILLLVKKWQFAYEESYTPWRLKRAAREAGLSIIQITGFLFMPPLATNNTELFPLKLRRRLTLLERYLPLKQYYCYSVCVVCKKG